jgi:hypothetical protein
LRCWKMSHFLVIPCSSGSLIRISFRRPTLALFEDEMKAEWKFDSNLIPKVVKAVVEK